MSFRRVAESVLVVSILGAVAAMLGGASGCGNESIQDDWFCVAPDGGDPYIQDEWAPSVRPAGCSCAVRGPETGPGNILYTYPQGDCDAGADGPSGYFDAPRSRRAAGGEVRPS
jgi:hypothetical protein